MISADYDSSYSLGASYRSSAMADVSANLRDPSGATVASARTGTGSASLSFLTPAGGSYTLELVNNSADTDVPSFAAPWSLSSTMTLALKDSSGSVIAQDASAAKPKTISRSLSAGRYVIAATPTGGVGTASLTASYPGRPAREQITYDGNDHAVSIDDGTQTISETLAPSGRVLRRRVTDDVTGEVSEDTIFGYDGDGDSPAYSRPFAGGTVTTYIAGPSGLLVIDTAGAASYPITNGHGDVVGSTDAAGAFTSAPAADEFGVGQAPPSRLGWLGGKERFSTGGNLGLIRMGVRLYDPALGRFLEVDTVEGGSCNDYDYVCGDPANGFDLDGNRCWRCIGRALGGAGKFLVKSTIIAGGAVAVCGVSFGVGCAVAVGAVIGAGLSAWDYYNGVPAERRTAGGWAQATVSGAWSGALTGGLGFNAWMRSGGASYRFGGFAAKRIWRKFVRWERF